MDTLEAILRPVVELLNRSIQESTPAKELCKDLSGTIVAVRVRNTALTAYFLIDDETLDVATSSSKEPDVIVCGSLITLARMNAKSSEAAIRDGSLDLSGDVRLADRFQKLLNHAKPDVEEELSSLIGDVAAHRLGEISRGVGRWGRDARSTMSANIREYLQEESRDVPSRYETDKFNENVSTLRDDVDRLEARVNRLQENL